MPSMVFGFKPSHSSGADPLFAGAAASFPFEGGSIGRVELVFGASCPAMDATTEANVAATTTVLIMSVFGIGPFLHSRLTPAETGFGTQAVRVAMRGSIAATWLDMVNCS